MTITIDDLMTITDIGVSQIMLMTIMVRDLIAEIWGTISVPGPDQMTILIVSNIGIFQIGPIHATIITQTVTCMGITQNRDIHLHGNVPELTVGGNLHRFHPVDTGGPCLLATLILNYMTLLSQITQLIMTAGLRDPITLRALLIGTLVVPYDLKELIKVSTIELPHLKLKLTPYCKTNSQGTGWGRAILRLTILDLKIQKMTVMRAKAPVIIAFSLVAGLEQIQLVLPEIKK